MTKLTTLQYTNTALQDIEARFFDIPFENSNFQNDMFVVAAQITPERAYRAIGLRIHSKLRALQECYFGERKSEIRIGELTELIESPDTTKWDKMRHELEIEHILTNSPYTDKLKNDAQREVACLYAHLEKLPQYTREQFEDGERQHFIERSTRQANGISGGQESLVNILTDSPALQNYQQQVLTNDNISRLRIEMENQFKGSK